MFLPNQVLTTTGFDINCKAVKVAVTFVRYLATPKVYEGGVNGTTTLDCVINEDGLNIMVDSTELFVA